MIKAAYIHIPFCTTICSYCDFCKYYYQENIVDTYLESLQKEIVESYEGETLKTIYVGGGTPSSLSSMQLERLMEILSCFQKQDNYEYTVECNIENITEEKIKIMKKYGVNRISIGIQTFQEKYLSLLKRNHQKEEVYEKIKMVKKYIENINVDLIYALPGETKEELEDDLNCFLSLDIPHISTYSLIIEEHTIFYHQGVETISEELDFSMYQLIEEKLKAYHHYEISNFSKKGYESQHNLTYWNNEEYYGFGVGASGYIKNIRYENTRSLKNYERNRKHIHEEVLSKQVQMENEMILGLRKLEGVSISHFQEKFSKNLLNSKEVKRLLEKGYLEEYNDYIRIPDKYLYTSNDILISFVDWKEDF